jgi:hypothetical protein
MGIFKNLINKILDAEVPPVVEQLVSKRQAQKTALDTESLKRNMYDWVTCGDKEVRPDILNLIFHCSGVN